MSSLIEFWFVNKERKYLNAEIPKTLIVCTYVIWVDGGDELGARIAGQRGTGQHVVHSSTNYQQEDHVVWILP